MVLTENDFFNIVFDTIRENPGDKTAMILMHKCVQQITKKVNTQIDTQEICDDVCNCMDYYNDFVVSKGLKMPVIGEGYYNMVVLTINALVGEILSRRDFE